MKTTHKIFTPRFTCLSNCFLCGTFQRFPGHLMFLLLWVSQPIITTVLTVSSLSSATSVAGAPRHPSPAWLKCPSHLQGALKTFEEHSACYKLHQGKKYSAISEGPRPNLHSFYCSAVIRHSRQFLHVEKTF